MIKEISKEIPFSYLDLKNKNIYSSPIKGVIIKDKWHYIAKEIGGLEIVVYQNLVIFQMFSIFEGNKQIYFDINDISYIGCVGYNLCFVSF